MENVSKNFWKRKLFGISHPVGKILICILVVGLLGGMGLLILIVGVVGDALLERRKQSKAACVALSEKNQKRG